MKKNINQGTTLFVVSGLNIKDANFSLLYVNKKATVNVEEEHMYSEYVGSEQVVTTKEDIEKMEGMSKLLAMGGGLSRTVHTVKQGIIKVMKPHTIIYDRNNNEHDIDAIWAEKNPNYFRNRKSANKYYRKLMAKSGLIFVDESNTFFHQDTSRYMKIK